MVILFNYCTNVEKEGGENKVRNSGLNRGFTGGCLTPFSRCVTSGVGRNSEKPQR